MHADDGSIELEDGSTMSADRIVVAAGAWVLKLFRTGRHADDLPDGARLCRAAGRPEGCLGGRAGSSSTSAQDRRLHDPADARRRHEVRVGPAQGRDQRCRLDREPVEGEGEAIRNLFSPRSPASWNIASPRW